MSLFKKHGTKLLGAATTVAGVVGAIDPLVLNEMLGPKGVSYLTGFMGILTILRGFQNSANQQPQPPIR